jgi:hypothetical protein
VAVQQPLLGMQAPAQGLYPALHAQPQLGLLHVAVANWGAGHGLQPAPHELTLVSARHWPPQLCVPEGHILPHAWLSATQAPAQMRVPVGHVAPQLAPSQVAVPPVGGVQAVHDEAPHEFGEALLTQVLPHRWKPPLQAVMQAWFAPQVALPLLTAGQSAVTQQPSAGTHELSEHFL